MAKKQLKLGELLLEAGLIDDIQLRTALSHQRNMGGRLGKSIIKLGYLTEEKILDFLAHQLKLERFDFQKQKVNPEAIDLVSTDRARHYQVVPVGFVMRTGRKNLQVATADPINLIVLDELQFVTGMRVEAVVVSEAELLKALDHYYPFDAVKGETPLSQEEEIVDLEEDNVLDSILQDLIATPSSRIRSDDGSPKTLDQRFQQLLSILLDKGILSIREFDRLKNPERLETNGLE